MRRKRVTRFFIILAVSIMSGCGPDGSTPQMTREEMQKKLIEGDTRTQSLEATLSAYKKDLDVLSNKVNEQLSADVDATRAYMKQVADNLRELHVKTALMLDTQNQYISEGRKAYLQVLEEEMKVLRSKLDAMDKAVDILKKEMPAAKEGLPSEPNVPAK